MRVAREAWLLGKESILGFINDNALSHGAAMAFYAVTSLAPILLIVVAIAGLVFGHDPLVMFASCISATRPKSAAQSTATVSRFGSGANRALLAWRRRSRVSRGLADRSLGPPQWEPSLLKGGAFTAEGRCPSPFPGRHQRKA